MSPLSTPPLPPEITGSVRFGSFVFDAHRGELRRAGTAIELRPQVESLLRLFLAQPGRLLLRAELHAALWPAVVVTEDSLVQCVSELRAALDDGKQRFVRTVRGRGYRWEWPIEPVATDVAAGASAAAAGSGPSPTPSSWRRRLVVPTALAGLLAGIAAVHQWTQPPVRIDEEITALDTVAVMPFDSAAGDAALAAYAALVADAVAGQFVNRLGMRSMGRAVTTAYIGKPIQQVASGLKARSLVRGHVTRSRTNLVSVDIQLISTVDGGTLWSQHADLSPDDPKARFALGQLVVNAVRHRGHPAATDRELSREGISAPARETILGWKELDAQPSLDTARRARVRFERALKGDPTSIIARNGVAASYQMEARDPRHPLSAADMERLEQLIDGTRAIAPDDANALLLWAALQTQHNRPDLAILAIERSIGIVPSYPNSYVLLARAKLAAGRAEEVSALVKKVIELGQDDAYRVSNAYAIGAEAALMLGQDLDAAALAARSVAEWPGNADGHALLAATEVIAGRPGPAQAEVRQVERFWPGFTVAHWERRHPLQPGRYEHERRQLLDALQRAGMVAG
jgi:DNA-binding winged helix-turn-helix (wHTH) protein/TolB-like protein/tetratricopeptide (TPR) repeat protein